MASNGCRWVRRLADDAGETTVEWTLLMVVIGLPMVAISAMLLSALVEFFRFVAFLQTLPL